MIFSIESIWEKYGNKYKAINIGSLEARRLKDEQSKGLLDANTNQILESLKKLVGGRIKLKS
jgi:hypothetical protein